MVAYTNNPITDPDQISYNIGTGVNTNDELCINTTAKTLILNVTGNLTTDGVTLKCLYSKLKEAWKNDSGLIIYPFPMRPITDEQFEFINGWNLDKVYVGSPAQPITPELIRTGGWAVINTSGVVTEMWASMITLGTLGSLDQVYYQQTSAGSAVNVVLTGTVNQAVQIYSDPNGDGSTADGFDRRTYFKIFAREYQKLYAQAQLSDIGVTTLTYQAYRFSLTNSTDSKITNNDATVGNGGHAIYSKINITYLRHTDGTLYNIRGNYNTSSVAYALADVVKDTGNNRWYKCILAYTSNATQPSSNATNWAAYEGERLIGTTYYAFQTIIDGDTDVATTASGDATLEQIYEKVQYSLRQNSDIDASSTGAITGKTASSLLRFVGDTLVTSTGVYVDSISASDTNRIEMYDYTGTSRTFPFIASLTINFGENLQNDADAIYRVFFTTLPGSSNDFGESGAVLVQDNSGSNMSGTVGGAASVQKTFNYDGNSQGGRTPATDAGITVVAIGLSTGQYVKTTGTITRSTSNSVSLVASLERNYSN